MVATAVTVRENGQMAKVIALAVEEGTPIGDVKYQPWPSIDNRGWLD